MAAHMPTARTAAATRILSHMRAGQGGQEEAKLPLRLHPYLSARHGAEVKIGPRPPYPRNRHV